MYRLPLLLTESSAVVTVESWLNFPLLKLGNASLTLLNFMSLAIWIVVIVVLNALIRRFFVSRLLARTHFDAGLQFALT